MKIAYAVVPLALLAVFTGYYIPYQADYTARLAVDEELAARRLALQREADAQRADAARADQQKQHADRVHAARLREQQARDEQLARDAAERTALDEARMRRDALRAELDALREDATNIRADYERSIQAHVIAQRHREERRIDRRNADLELQLATQRLADRVQVDVLTEAELFPRPESGTRF